MDIETALKEAMQVDGAVGVSLVDAESGMMLGSAGGSREFDLETASAGNTEVVRSMRRALDVLGVRDGIEDILVSLDRQYHLVRLLERADSPLFLYLVLDRSRANLALARHSLRLIARALDL